MEQLMLGCLPSLRRYARALTGDATSADDLVQDTLARAWERSTSWSGMGDIRPWLFSIMHNLRMDLARKPALSTVPIDDDALAIADNQRPPDSLALRDLDNALRKLSDDHREVLLLVGLEDMSYAQVAEVLGCPVGSVMSRLSRARANLRTLLETGADQPLRVVR
ncbi:sigma-70 family RNA polymerase sigma factor [Duganella ginsengisoli]|uniref:Sigma-70 family RNA polymerase sigma factor n=2 Tax=Pseudoduganella ginsengisoli TaxID=1462440 RepID=A0A6L6Q8U8_9BURK|nr:sigma-70 family RNA polymerase sigma factor [Pseudoduganella ginsengisoli]